MKTDDTADGIRPLQCHRPTPRLNLFSLSTAVLLQFAFAARSRGEDRALYKFELYQEDSHRIEVATQSALGEVSVTPTLSLKGEFIYDSISGATPVGTPPSAGSSQVPLAELRDLRRAGTFELTQKINRYTITPQLAYSKEHDYESIAVALTQSLDFNNKNTTVTLGVDHDFDRVLPAKSLLRQIEHKDTTDAMVGVTQLLGPKTVLTANFTFGHAEGYLSDPYKGFRFDYYPDPDAYFPENRPKSRDREVAYFALTQFITPANASIEVSYRLHHDTFDVWAHTASLAWFQKIGRHVTLQPIARYYDQTAASFYATHLPGDPSLSLDGIPSFYSSDYRLSAFHSWTYGLVATLKLHDRVSIDAAYKRYEMIGNDSVTPASAYAKANVFTFGLSLTF